MSKKIPSAVRQAVWNIYHGESVGTAKCYTGCGTSISQAAFHCGHIQATINGGRIHIQNLRPICQKCNTSMRAYNMKDFCQRYGFQPLGSLEWKSNEVIMEDTTSSADLLEDLEEEYEDNEEFVIHCWYDISKVLRMRYFNRKELKMILDKLQVNYCGENREFLSDILQEELENSTAYDIYALLNSLGITAQAGRKDEFEEYVQAQIQRLKEINSETRIAHYRYILYLLKLPYLFPTMGYTEQDEFNLHTELVITNNFI